MKKGFIYLLESKQYNKFYLGSTDNPARRIEYHNNGYSRATKNFTPWNCILIVKIGTLKEARQVEYYIKKQKEKLIIKNVVKILNRYFE